MSKVTMRVGKTGGWRYAFCRLLVLAVCLAAVCVMMAGCSQEEPPVQGQENAVPVYYKNISHTGINYYMYQSEASTREEQILDVWDQICRKPTQTDRESAIPSEVLLLTFSIEGSNLNLYFNSALAQLDTTSQLLLRAAVVKTFCGIAGIETVTFFADEKPLTDSNYTPLGAQSSSDYVDIISNGLSTTRKTTLVLYYTDETGENLRKYTHYIVYGSSYSL